MNSPPPLARTTASLKCGCATPPQDKARTLISTLPFYTLEICAFRNYLLLYILSRTLSRCPVSRKHCLISRYVLSAGCLNHWNHLEERVLTICIQFTAKQLNRQAAKASKDEKTEKDKLKKVRSQIPSTNPSLLQAES